MGRTQAENFPAFKRSSVGKVTLNYQFYIDRLDLYTAHKYSSYSVVTGSKKSFGFSSSSSERFSYISETIQNSIRVPVLPVSSHDGIN